MNFSVIAIMLELCVERGEDMRSQITNIPDYNRLGKFLLDLGLSHDAVDMLVYKDKLNHMIIWYFAIISMTLTLIVIIICI